MFSGALSSSVSSPAAGMMFCNWLAMSFMSPMNSSTESSDVAAMASVCVVGLPKPAGDSLAKRGPKSSAA